MAKAREDVSKLQAAEATRGEEIMREERSVVMQNGSLYTNIPASADRIVSFGEAADVEIRIYHDHIEVWPDRGSGNEH